VLEDELRPEYEFDYRTAQGNPYAARIAVEGYVVVVDPDPTEVPRNPKTVHAVLRALKDAKPRTQAGKPPPRKLKV